MGPLEEVVVALVDALDAEGIVTKLRWLRMKDRADIVAVMSVQGNTLDWAYIEHWADAHGTRGSLEELRRIAGVAAL